MNKIILAILVLVTLGIFRNPGPVWLFPIFLIAYQYKDKLYKEKEIIKNKKKLKWLPKHLGKKYVLTGILIGIFLEILSIINNMGIEIGKKTLFHQKPIQDIILALGYYGILAIAGYWILRKYKYSILQFFTLGSIFGIVFEQHGKILLGLFNLKILDGIYVMLTYGSFFGLNYLIYLRYFKEQRLNPGTKDYLKSFLSLGIAYFCFLIYYYLANLLL